MPEREPLDRFLTVKLVPLMFLKTRLFFVKLTSSATITV